MTLRILFRSAILIGLLVLLGYTVKALGLENYINEQIIDAYIRPNGIGGQLFFIAIASIFASIGFPRQIISFLAGYGFGLTSGFFIALLACIFGCIISFNFARFVCREWVQIKFSDRLEKADNFFIANTFSTTLMIRLMPAGSNVITNFLAGISGARSISFFSGSALGYVPQTIIFAMLGSGFNVDAEIRIGLSIFLFLLSLLLGIFLFRRYSNN